MNVKFLRILCYKCIVNRWIETLVPSKGPSVNEVFVRNVNDPMPTGQGDIGTILLSLSEMDTIVSHYATS